MAFDDYTSPIFGDRDMQGYSVPALDMLQYGSVNRADVVQKNDKGRTYAADVSCLYTSHLLTGTQNLQSQSYLFLSRIVSDPTRPLCILAIPRTYGNHQNTEEASIYKYYAGLVNSFNDIPCFNYYLIGKTGGASLDLYFDIKVDTNNYVSDIHRIRNIKYNPPEVYGELPPIYDSDTREQTATYRYDNSAVLSVSQSIERLPERLTTLSSNTRYGERWYSVNQDIVRYSGSDIIRLSSLITTWAATSETVKSIVFYDFSAINYDSINGNVIGSQIFTGLPVFTLDSFTEMINYFDDKPFISDNDTNLPPSDWSTDWTVYVKGANRPNLYITMESKKVDEWLAGGDNSLDISKNDISVEWRYPVYKQNEIMDSPVLYPYKPDTTVNWPITQYDNTKETSYLALVELNYTNLASAIGVPLEGSESSLQVLLDNDIYSQLQFRIRYDKYYSNWCYFKIGVIGSPSIPDFSRMNNEGAQLLEGGFTDSSTVTIIYDEYPPGYDPYPTPGDPNPTVPTPGKDDLLPSVIPGGVNGIGLLTRTYKLNVKQTQMLGQYIWGYDIFEKIKNLNLAPLENIVSVKTMPLDIAGTPSNIVIGDIKTSVAGEIVETVPIMDIGEFEFKGRYGNFLDYSPYTHVSLFLPFVGFVQIDPFTFTNHTLSVKYAFDLILGGCRAMLFSDGIYIESFVGNCGIDIPLVSTNRADIQAAIVNSALGGAEGAVLHDKAPSASSVVGGAALGAIHTYIGSTVHASREGTYSPVTAWNETRVCYIVIDSPNASYSSSYNHDFGRPCEATYNLSQLRGFTQTSTNIDLSGVNATDEELTMIRNLLSSGVYL